MLLWLSAAFFLALPAALGAPQTLPDASVSLPNTVPTSVSILNAPVASSVPSAPSAAVTLSSAISRPTNSRGIPIRIASPSASVVSQITNAPNPNSNRAAGGPTGPSQPADRLALPETPAGSTSSSNSQRPDASKPSGHDMSVTTYIIIFFVGGIFIVLVGGAFVHRNFQARRKQLDAINRKVDLLPQKMPPHFYTPAHMLPEKAALPDLEISGKGDMSGGPHPSTPDIWRSTSFNQKGHVARYGNSPHREGTTRSNPG
ncbi:hypothetical protein BASA82_001172 [Batrachochytrium salamandrivorans]|uniref:Uncharacterized protein n=1 Tax=Batrachochytrium salamandrivorans TaxID=1357716 RepID=A0ABQ8F788_9FUNG|nr:hypothetical protein BASA60_010413 [Batrachochytrium salamandrivorans]KAH6567327.1 hypothetical protein BASA62_006150 [Batrachochytrium salamandrivorans]KAH6593421.1 hypothetical protein BASA50_007372 [Batrachochytrium salamandrivorans]KAH9259857.1 hypothetical protein BASA82_001172 [Batrachochytrium salamandrivorans]